MERSVYARHSFLEISLFIFGGNQLKWVRKGERERECNQACYIRLSYRLCDRHFGSCIGRLWQHCLEVICWANLRIAGFFHSCFDFNQNKKKRRQSLEMTMLGSAEGSWLKNWRNHFTMVGEAVSKNSGRMAY